ncbi:MAG: hypothetical protein IKV57_04700 [Clostridia bacterium]|nr:hypothetical protein [Clostridia bacterium]
MQTTIAAAADFQATFAANDTISLFRKRLINGKPDSRTITIPGNGEIRIGNAFQKMSKFLCSNLHRNIFCFHQYNRYIRLSI